MTNEEAQALAKVINASEKAQKHGWHAEARLILHLNDDNLWDGEWYAVIEDGIRHEALKGGYASYVFDSQEAWDSFMGDSLTFA